MKTRIFACLLALCLLLPMTAALAEITYPLDTDLTITVWYPWDAGNSQVFTNLGDNPVYQKFQETTGVKIEFLHPTFGAEKEGFSTTIAGDKLPDLMIDFSSYYRGGLQAGYDDGMIYDLAPYLEENAPAYYALINQSPEVRRQFYTEEDQCLAFAVFGQEADAEDFCLSLRADWCEEFGINPADLKTFDDLEKYFQAVLDNKPGVVPLLSGRAAIMETLGMGYNVVENWMAIDGKVQYYATTQGFHDWLARLHSWYEKGYIGVDFGTVKNAEARKIFAAGQSGSVICPDGNAASDARAAGITIVKAPYPQVHVGDPVHVWLDQNNNRGQNTVITTSLDEKLVPTVVQMMNFAYTEEGSIFTNWGPEGMSWNWVDGERKHTDWVMNNELYGTSIMHNVCRMHYWPRLSIPGTECNPNLLIDPAVVAMRTLYSDTPNWDCAWKIPSAMTLTTDENNDRAKYMTDVNTYVSEMRMKFITGEANLESDWDAYVQQLNKYGLEKAVEITQAAYDRYMSR